MAAQTCAGCVFRCSDRGGRNFVPQGGNWRATAPATTQVPLAAEPGTAVGDLQALDKNHELYSDFDVLDDLQVQQDVNANP